MQQPMKRNICKNCNGSTDCMFSMNEGIYCDKCKEIGLLIQKYNLETQAFKERMRISAERWTASVYYQLSKNA